MNKNYVRFFLRISVGICLALFGSCTHEEQTITGRVMDESGNGIAGAAVRVCYTWWGWSSGGVVWDKVYCSAPVLTDSSGAFTIVFNGPELMRLLAGKEGWVQTKDFNSTAPHIILTRWETYISREKSGEELREKAFRMRQPGESDAEYYCRVVMRKAGKIVLTYKGEEITIIQGVFKYSDTHGFFAITGSRKLVENFTEEVEFRMNEKRISKGCFIREDVTGCKSDMYFIEFALPETPSAPDKKVEVYVPSVRAGFHLNVWE